MAQGLGTPVCAHLPHPGPSAPFLRHRVTPTNPLTNRAGHTHSSSHCNRLPHTQSHIYLWVFGSVQFGFLTLQGQFRFSPPPIKLEDEIFMSKYHSANEQFKCIQCVKLILNVTGISI